MPTDLDQLAQDTDHQDRWGMAPTGNGLQDIATRGLPPPQPTPYGVTRAQEHQRRYGLPGAGGQLADLAKRAGQGAVGQFEEFGDRVKTAMYDEDPYTRAYVGAGLAKNIVEGGMGAAPKGALGMAGGAIKAIPRFGSPEALSYYGKTIGMPENEFASRLWGGLHNPTMTITHFDDAAGRRLAVSGRLIDNGQVVGRMSRTLYPEEGRAYHDLMDISDDLQSGGYSKRIVASELGLYPLLGIKKLGITATGEGAAQWGKHGFKPHASAWNGGVKDTISENFKDMNRMGFQFTDAEKFYVGQALKSRDPEAMWLINDLNRKYRPLDDPNWRPGYPLTSPGRDLLQGSFWSGEFDLMNNAQANRARRYLKDYIGKTYP